MPILLLLISLAFAAEKYGVYDLQGNRISTFEAEWFDLPEKTQQVKQKNPYKRLYVSSLKKGKAVKPASRYRYKAETGAYIEASKKETFSVCPDKETQGTWISEHSVYLNEANCLSVQAPNLAGTFQILFMENSGRTDTIQVLVEQSYIQMGDYSHKIWVSDMEYETCIIDYPCKCNGDVCYIFSRSEIEKNGHYESRSYSQPLIVDKTKLTMGDALYYHKIDTSLITHWTFKKKEYKNKKLEESNLPLIGMYLYNAWRFANMRSKKEGLDTVYYINDSGALAIDSSASGYRLPSKEEWFFLMRAGASTRYYWGNEEDSLSVSRYEWVKPIGLKPVAQRLPNSFGLYDMAGIAKEWFHRFDKTGYSTVTCGEFIPECLFIKEMGAQEEYVEPSSTVCEIKPGQTEWKTITGDGECTTTGPELRTRRVSYPYLSIRLLRKTPKLHKLEKF